MTELGLEVKTVVCDQGSNNVKAVKALGVSEDRPYFWHGDNKIFLIYDPPHLIKSIRNNLKKSGFARNGKDIEWGYIRQFFHVDSTNSVRMAPKLTKNI